MDHGEVTGSAEPPGPSGRSSPDEPGGSAWGVRDAIWGWVAAIVLGAVFGGLIVMAAGYGEADTDALPLWLVAVTQIPLWIGLLGAPLWAAHKAHSTVARQFGLRFRAVDVPVGLVLGVAAQFLVVPAISWPWLKLLGRSADDLSGPAQELVGKATDPWGVVLLVLVVVIGAPLVEELFYRGLLLRSLQKLLPVWVAIVVSGLAFGASHFQLLGFPALAVFGMLLALLAWRTGRLGIAVFTHVGFNAVTVWALLS